MSVYLPNPEDMENALTKRGIIDYTRDWLTQSISDTDKLAIIIQMAEESKKALNDMGGEQA